MNIVIDTNLLLDDPRIIYKLAAKYEKVIVPLTVLKELDKHKFNRDLSYSARSAIYEIVHFRQQHPDKIELVVTDEEMTDNDARIMKVAQKTNSEIATKDISMSAIAEAVGIHVELYNVVTNGFFNPYYYIKDDIVFDNFDISKKYTANKYESVLNYLGTFFDHPFNKDAWCFIFIEVKGKIEYIYANNPFSKELIRIDNIPEYRAIKVDNTTVKAMDAYQVCAFYALEEAPNTLITGKWGSGKTLLSTAYTLSTSLRKTFIIRPPVAINSKFSMGYLPGGVEDKLTEYHSGFLSSLYYIYANTRNQKCEGKDCKSENIEYDFVKDNIFRKKFEILPIPALQGVSLLEDDVLIVDETQLLDIDTLSMVLSRISEGSKLILLGDLAQTYNVVRPSESGLLKLRRILPHKYIAHVDLKNSYRSELIELADKLQDKTIE